MPKFRLALLTFALLIIPAIYSNAAANKATCYTVWDDLYLYVAFDVPDPDIRSTNTTHMSKTWEDDSVEVYVETDAARAQNRTESTYRLSATPGGGTNFDVGVNGEPVEKKIFTFKFAKSVAGSINRPNDKDTGYTIELAIPWREMGFTPEVGKIIGFNAVIRLKGDNVGFTSLSPDVKAEEDLNNPSKWTKIYLSDEAPSIVSIRNGAYVCKKVRIKSPVIDGTIAPNEWVKNLAMEIPIPDPPAQLPKDVYVIENPVFTHYFYWYQANKRKEAPYLHMVNEDGSDALTNHPLEGCGFWISYDSVDWHKQQLANICNAGIDTILPVYWGSATDKKAFATKGLSSMVQALKELKSERKSYPLIAMFFDTTSMMVQYGEKPDLKQDEVKQTFYGMIKDFFLNVPDEFAVSVQLPADRSGKAANVIVLYTSAFFSDLDSSFIDYCNQQFEKDFGRKLIWVGAVDFRNRGVQLDAYTNYGAGLGLQYDNNGWFSIAGVGAGFDNAAVPGGNAYRPRYNGETYKKDWNALIAVNPNWVVVDGWNELHEGSDIAPNREYGDRYVDLTKINVLRFNGMRQYDAKYLKHNIPSAMMPGLISSVNLVVRNDGTKPWLAGQGIYIAGRWYKDGQLVSDSGARLPMQGNVLAGQLFTKAVGIKAVDQEGKPLPEGDYELRIDMMHGAEEWFSSGGDVPLCVPVKITSEPRAGFTLVSSTLPSMIKQGAVYDVGLQIRNDGSSTWKAGTKIGYRWYKASVHLGSSSNDGMELVGANESAATIPTDVEPGRVIDVLVRVSALGADGEPLPVWKADDMWTYLIKWDVNDNGIWLASDKAGEASEAVKIMADDYGVRFISNDMPRIMSGGKKYSTTIIISNNGTDEWLKKEMKLGYHVCGIDGTEILWDGPTFALPEDVKPGESVDIAASVIAPENDGQYYIIWDMMHGDKWLSSSSNTKGGYILMNAVNVNDGNIVPIDLSALLNEDIISTDTNPGDGALDDTGMAIPAQFMPPYFSPVVNPELWACSKCAKSENGTAQQISFAFPSKMNGSKNVVSCSAQSIPIKSGKYTAMHILAISAQDASGDIGISYQDRKTTSALRVFGWDAAPSGEAAHEAFRTPYRYSANGIVRQPVYINHYVIPLDSKANCTGVTLPNMPSIKILAITMQKAR